MFGILISIELKFKKKHLSEIYKLSFLKKQGRQIVILHHDEEDLFLEIEFGFYMIYSISIFFTTYGTLISLHS